MVCITPQGKVHPPSFPSNQPRQEGKITLVHALDARCKFRLINQASCRIRSLPILVGTQVPATTAHIPCLNPMPKPHDRHPQLYVACESSWPTSGVVQPPPFLSARHTQFWRPIGNVSAYRAIANKDPMIADEVNLVSGAIVSGFCYVIPEHPIQIDMNFRDPLESTEKFPLIKPLSKAPFFSILPRC